MSEHDKTAPAGYRPVTMDDVLRAKAQADARKARRRGLWPALGAAPVEVSPYVFLATSRRVKGRKA